jgi:uracil-DNA glycosylase family protein
VSPRQKDLAGDGAEDASAFLPQKRTIEALRDAVQDCRGCDLWHDATQAVFGEGPSSARLMLVGEQPGDREDVEGEPFVGPAGGVLRKALTEAGIDVDAIYVTNAVKHFKWRPRGKRRLHQTPRVGEINACRPWLEAEVGSVGPEAVVALGATAARSLFGTGVKVMRDRGSLLESDLAPIATVTIHPSAVLRAGDEREEAYASLVADLGVVVAALD